MSLDEALKQLRNQQEQLLQKVTGLEKPQGKDMWDKLGALTGLLVAVVGGIFSFLYSYHQSNLDSITQAHQQKLQEVQTVGTFMPYLVGTDDSARSIAFAEVQSILGSKAAILIVDELNSARKTGTSAGPDPVAVRFLQRVVDNAKALDEDKDLAGRSWPECVESQPLSRSGPGRKLPILGRLQPPAGGKSFALASVLP